MKFTKMQGLGNDYVYVNCLEETVENPASLARMVSDRHFGIGSDGLILIRPSACADFFMEMFNADGSRSQMCGNGIRCVGKYVYDHGLTEKTELSVNTLAGVKRLQLHVSEGSVESATVDMGAPELEPSLIPVTAKGRVVQLPERAGWPGERMAGRDLRAVVGEPISVAGRNFEMTCVSMGNPHAVVFVGDTSALAIEDIGQRFEVHLAFPERVNAEFVHVLNRHEVNMRVWERGTGETLACGTGACATAVACILNGVTDDEVTVHLLGGDLRVRWDAETGHVFMTGPAATVFEGQIDTCDCPQDDPPHEVDPDW